MYTKYSGSHSIRETTRSRRRAQTKKKKKLLRRLCSLIKIINSARYVDKNGTYTVYMVGLFEDLGS